MHYLKYLNSIPSFEGKTICITGANSGIGFTLAKQIAFKGGHVIMACRSQERASKAKDKILEEIKDAKVDILKYDQASFSSIEEFSESIKKLSSLDGFVFNAGIYHPKKDMKTSDGYPLTIGTNYLGAFYLAQLLKDFFKEKNTKVVVVTSVAAHIGHYHNLEKVFSKAKGSTKEYAISKRCGYSLASYLYSYLGKNVYLSHPGIAGTSIINGEASSFSKFFKKIGVSFMKHCTNSPEKSSLTSLRALASDASIYALYCPRGLFHLGGYPKKIKIAPCKLRSDKLIEYSKKLIIK